MSKKITIEFKDGDLDHPVIFFNWALSDSDIQKVYNAFFSSLVNRPNIEWVKTDE